MLHMVAATEFLGPDNLFDDPTAPVRILVDNGGSHRYTDTTHRTSTAAGSVQGQEVGGEKKVAASLCLTCPGCRTDSPVF